MVKGLLWSSKLFPGIIERLGEWKSERWDLGLWLTGRGRQVIWKIPKKKQSTIPDFTYTCRKWSTKILIVLRARLTESLFFFSLIISKLHELIQHVRAFPACTVCQGEGQAGGCLRSILIGGWVTQIVTGGRPNVFLARQCHSTPFEKEED